LTPEQLTPADRELAQERMLELHLARLRPPQGTRRKTDAPPEPVREPQLPPARTFVLMSWRPNGERDAVMRCTSLELLMIWLEKTRPKRLAHKPARMWIEVEGVPAHRFRVRRLAA
jgi:hypothetical protein